MIYRRIVWKLSPVANSQLLLLLPSCGSSWVNQDHPEPNLAFDSQINKRHLDLPNDSAR